MHLIRIFLQGFTLINQLNLAGKLVPETGNSFVLFGLLPTYFYHWEVERKGTQPPTSNNFVRHPLVSRIQPNLTHCINHPRSP